MEQSVVEDKHTDQIDLEALEKMDQLIQAQKKARTFTVMSLRMLIFICMISIA